MRKNRKGENKKHTPSFSLILQIFPDALSDQNRDFFLTLTYYSQYHFYEILQLARYLHKLI